MTDDIEFAPGMAPVAPALAFEPIEAFAAVDEPGAEPLARAAAGGAAIANGSLVLVYGTGGAGKTTLVLDLCFALANGTAWARRAPASPLRIAIIENEVRGR